MSNEIHFELSGKVNKKNFCYWSVKNPKQIHERPTSCRNVTVGCGVARFRIIKLNFFHDNEERTVAVNLARYIVMIRDFLVPQLRLLGIDTQAIWFKQDGATGQYQDPPWLFYVKLFPRHSISQVGWCSVVCAIPTPFVVWLLATGLSEKKSFCVEARDI